MVMYCLQSSVSNAALTSRKCFPPCWQWVNILPAPQGQPLALGVREQDSLLFVFVCNDEWMRLREKKHAATLSCLGSWCLPAVFILGNPDWTGGICSCRERANLAIVFVSFAQETDLIVIVPCDSCCYSARCLPTSLKRLRTHFTCMSACIPVSILIWF